MFGFSNRVVMITGAAGALGQAVTGAFQNAGAKLVLLDQDADLLNTLFRHLIPEHLLFGAIDVTDPGAVERGVQQTIERFGRIDVLVNTVGGYRAGTPVHETPLETWELMMNLNARSVFVMCRAVVPQMLKQGQGKIVNVAARAALSGFADTAAYCASKSAVIRLTESLSAELKEKGINVNCVLPSIIDTPANRAARPDADFSRWVPPEVLTDVILFLASDASRAIHGASIPVYGLA